MTSLYFTPSERLSSLLEEGPLGERLPRVWLYNSHPGEVYAPDWDYEGTQDHTALALIHENRVMLPSVWALVASMPDKSIWESPHHLMRPAYIVADVVRVARICERLDMGRVVTGEDRS